MDDRLKSYRNELKQCDDKIIDALIERSMIIEQIMSYKEANNFPVLQPLQEAYGKEAWIKRIGDNKYKDELMDVMLRVLHNSKRIQARKLFSFNIILIGFMGVGKSTVSDFLSEVFAMDIVEMDQTIVDRERMSISDIFEVYGEEYFRNLETNLLIEMQSRKNTVVSCGGGAAMRDENVEEMKKNGRVVLLTASAQTILDRVIDSDNRPLLHGNKNVDFIQALIDKRRKKYEAAADIIVDTDDKSILEICEELVQKLTDID